jgi:hypothetical protein
MIVLIPPAQNNNEGIVRLSLEEERKSRDRVCTAVMLKKGTESRNGIVEHTLRKLRE